MSHRPAFHPENHERLVKAMFDMEGSVRDARRLANATVLAVVGASHSDIESPDILEAIELVAQKLKDEIDVVAGIYIAATDPATSGEVA